MASLYRKPIVTTDPESGEKVKTQSRKWWGQFRDGNGKLRRHSLAVDKRAAQAMLNDLVRKAELESAGLVDPTEQHRSRPIKDHLAEFESYMKSRSLTSKQVHTVNSHVTRMITDCKWKRIDDISVSSTQRFLGELRGSGRSAQTANHYLVSIKSFANWLVKDQRTHTNPIAHIRRQNVASDRRHLRRVLSDEEFTLLVEAARTGKPVESIPGRDRAMMYILAAWTGFRKSELGSLTLRSLDLDGDPPTATVEAGFSKRRRRDTQVLHPEVVEQLRNWIWRSPNLSVSAPLFPVSGKMPGGVERKANKMIRRDLESARQTWIEDAKDDKREHRRRNESDFLAYEDHSGRYADFHSLRHRFITRLQQANVSPKVAQTLARHSDIRLTMEIYTHVEVAEQVAAIGSLALNSSESHAHQ